MGARFLRLAYQGAIHPSALRQLRHWTGCKKKLISKRNNLFPNKSRMQ